MHILFLFAILLDCSEKTTCQAFDSGNTTLMANKIENGKAQNTKTLLFFQPKCTGRADALAVTVHQGLKLQDTMAAYALMQCLCFFVNSTLHTDSLLLADVYRHSKFHVLCLNRFSVKTAKIFVLPLVK